MLRVKRSNQVDPSQTGFNKKNLKINKNFYKMVIINYFVNLYIYIDKNKIFRISYFIFYSRKLIANMKS